MFKIAILYFQILQVKADMMRKSIVFDKKTPGVFYCPQHKPSGKLFYLFMLRNNGQWAMEIM